MFAINFQNQKDENARHVIPKYVMLGYHPAFPSAVQDVLVQYMYAQIIVKQIANYQE